MLRKYCQNISNSDEYIYKFEDTMHIIGFEILISWIKYNVSTCLPKPSSGPNEPQSVLTDGAKNSSNVLTFNSSKEFWKCHRVYCYCWAVREAQTPVACIQSVLSEAHKFGSLKATQIIQNYSNGPKTVVSASENYGYFLIKHKNVGETLRSRAYAEINSC
jgi:hypothetical protein